MKRIIVLLTACLIGVSVSGCGNTSSNGVDIQNETSSGETVAVEIESIEDLAPADTSMTSESGQDILTTDTPDRSEDDKKHIKVAVMGAPASEILLKANESLESSSYIIEPVICTDYEQPNTLVLSGEADASLYENQVFLDSYNKKNSTDLVICERVYYEPLALFGGTATDISSLTGPVRVAVPKGDVNKARSLYLLEQKGLIELKEGAYYQASMEDVTNNPHNISIEEVDYSAGWPDASAYSLIICDYNRAMLAGIDPLTSLGDENRNSGIIDMFSICLVTDKSKTGNEKIKELSKALNSENTEEFIKETYHDSVVDYR